MRQRAGLPGWVLWVLTVIAVVLVAAGPVVQTLVPGDGELRSPKERLITFAWLATCVSVAWLVAMLVRLGGPRRDAALAARFPEALVFGAARMGEALTAYRRLIAPRDPRRERLPLLYSVVADTSGISIWGGGGASARQLLEIPAAAIAGYSLTFLNDSGTQRATIVVELIGLPVEAFPISPVGGGLHGLAALSEPHVAELSRELARRIPRASPAAKPQGS